MEKPWLKSYDELGIPHSLNPYPEVPLFSFLDKVAEDYPQDTALVYLGGELKYKELKLEVDRLATALFDLGIRKGDRVATILPTSPQFIISDNAILKNGASNLTLSPLEKAPELEHELSDAGVKTVIIEEQSLNLIQEIQPKLNLQNIILTSLKDYSPEQKEAGLREKAEGTNLYSLRELTGKYPPSPPQVEIDPRRDLALLSFTGGATGIPKGVMFTHYNLTSCMRQCDSMWGDLCDLMRLFSSLLLAVPFSHIFGHIVAHYFLCRGITMLLVSDPRDYESMFRLREKYHPLLQLGVPTQFMKQVGSEELKKGATLAGSATAALPPEVQEKYESKAGGAMSQGYGMTEVLYTHTDPRILLKSFGGSKMVRMLKLMLGQKEFRDMLSRIVEIVGREKMGEVMDEVIPFMTSLGKGKEEEAKGSVGIPLPDVDVRIVDEKGEDVPTGGSGEILISGPQVMLGYWPTPGSGVKDGWVATGDIGRMDERGYFYILDRTKDMANISGYKVYTRMVDDVLFEHPAVEMVATIGIPDAERPGSERIKVFIKLKPGYDGKVTPEEVREFCRGKLPPYAIPKFVEFRDDLPLTATQKIFKRKLREEEVGRMG